MVATPNETPTPVDPAAPSGPVELVAECEALRAEVERLRVLLGIDQWGPEVEPANVREVAATEVRRLVARERDEARAQLAAAEARLEAVQALHRQKTFDGYSDHHHAAAVAALGAISPHQHDCTDACFETFTICAHDGLAWPCSTAAALASPPEPEADERPTPLSAEIREIAEMWLYDGDTDQPINDGYFRALDLANRLESPKGAS